MTDTFSGTAHDLASMRAIAEEGRRRPLQSGPFLVVWGSVVSLALLVTYGSLTGSLPITPQNTWMIWLPLMTLGGIGSAVMGARQTSADSVTLSAKVEQVTWSVGGGFIGLICFGLYFLTAINGEKLRAAGAEPTLLFAMISPMAFGVYAVALAASAVAGRAKWLWGFVALSLLFAAATLFLVGDGKQFMVAISGIITTTILPGAIMMWRNRGV